MSENTVMFRNTVRAVVDVAIRAFVLVSIAAGCGGDLGGQGGERQPCFPNGTCNLGLTCSSNVCVDLGGGGRGGAGGTTAAAGRAGAAGTGATTGVGGIVGSAGTSGGGGVSGQGGGLECGSFERPASRLPADILIVQDASGSMNEDTNNLSCVNGGCGANSKWALMTPAINQVVSETEATVNWGLKLYADMGSQCGVAPNTVAVGIAPMNAGAIAAALAARTDANGNVTNGSSTPTRAAENAAVTYLTGLTDANPKFILLATDGQPNCPASGPTTSDDTAGAIAAVVAARAAGIPTFVVGISAPAGAADSALNLMAVEGGYPRAATPQYYPVTSTAEFTAVLRTLVGMANTCTFSVPPPPTNDGTSREHIIVRAAVGGTVVNLPLDANNGWTYGDAAMTSIVLHGAACDQVKAGTLTGITIAYLCLIR